MQPVYSTGESGSLVAQVYRSPVHLCHIVSADRRLFQLDLQEGSGLENLYLAGGAEIDISKPDPLSD